MAKKNDRIDHSALILLSVAALSFLLPELVTLFSKVKKVKWGEFEAEFEKDLRKLEQKIVVAESETRTSKRSSGVSYAPLYDSYVKEYQSIVSSPLPGREKIILGAVLAERMIQETVNELELSKSGRLGARTGMQLLLEEGFITSSEVDAFEEFWKVRNTAVHGPADGLSEHQISRLLDLLWRLVKVFG
ncbi:hypothetical protein [Nitrosomonas sp. Is79A3]|uniref:hypothetical protein n=1 Tax=Nitrosomonas sp. (strain Is79A3) TaxID=261292 RepID=UPI0012E9F454